MRHVSEREDLRIGHVDTGFDPATRGRLLAARGNTVPECRHCPVRDRCMNWCECGNHASTGFINVVPDVVCRHEQHAIAAADRVAAVLFGERNPAFIRRFYGDIG